MCKRVRRKVYAYSDSVCVVGWHRLGLHERRQLVGDKITSELLKSLNTS